MGFPTDTIAALATPAGTAALATLRASGSHCAELAAAILERAPLPRMATHVDYRNRHGDLVDDVILTYFQGPQSYSGEDALEITCHGNPLIAQLILEDLLARGLRAAEPGEFTRRAFLNGRIDLSQAEAVIDIIHARSERALAAARHQLRGGLARHLHELVERLLQVLAQVEAYIDFPDEDLPPEDRSRGARELAEIHRGMQRLLATSHYGELLRGGVRTVIMGEPNAGKSSLLNRLVGRERALVSPQPGTTRDYIEESIMVGPHSLRLIDTAGLNPTPEAIERLGMDRTLEQVEQAHLVLLVLDATRPSPTLPPEALRCITSANTLVVINKTDLLKDGARPAPPAGFDSQPVLHSVSALTGEGIEELIDAITRHVDALAPGAGDEQIAVNARHADALRRGIEAIEAASSKLSGQQPVELLASDLRSALDSLGEIGGRIDNERMLDHLFASFCIGK